MQQLILVGGFVDLLVDRTKYFYLAKNSEIAIITHAAETHGLSRSPALVNEKHENQTQRMDIRGVRRICC